MGIPAPLSLVAPIMVRVTPIHIQEAPKTFKQVVGSGAVAVFSTDQDRHEDQIQAGMQLQYVWLNATAAGLSAMPVVAAVEAGPDFRRQVREFAQTNAYPQSILRIGYSTKDNLKPTPRRTLEECLQ